MPWKQVQAGPVQEGKGHGRAGVPAHFTRKHTPKVLFQGGSRAAERSRNHPSRRGGRMTRCDLVTILYRIAPLTKPSARALPVERARPSSGDALEVGG